MHLMAYHYHLHSPYSGPQESVKPLQAFSLYPVVHVILHSAAD
jgi:hypothetical protein